MKPSDRKICQYCGHCEKPKCALTGKFVKKKNSCGKFTKEAGAK